MYTLLGVKSRNAAAVYQTEMTVVRETFPNTYIYTHPFSVNPTSKCHEACKQDRFLNHGDRRRAK